MKPQLSPRELDVLELICVGLETQAIGRRLNLSPITVRHLTQSLLRKMNAQNRTTLAVKALCAGIVQVFVLDNDEMTLGKPVR